jgi:hypothetical protein
MIIFVSGYNDILLIPAGATNIQVREVQASNNYLGLYHSRTKIMAWRTILCLLRQKSLCCLKHTVYAYYNLYLCFFLPNFQVAVRNVASSNTSG